MDVIFEVRSDDCRLIENALIFAAIPTDCFGYSSAWIKDKGRRTIGNLIGGTRKSVNLAQKIGGEGEGNGIRFWMKSMTKEPTCSCK